MVTHLQSEGFSGAERTAMLCVASEDNTYKKSIGLVNVTEPCYVLGSKDKQWIRHGP